MAKGQPYPCKLSERTYLTPSVCYNLRALISLECGSVYLFARENSLSETLLKGILYASNGMIPSYLELFIKLGYLHPEHGAYGISFKDQVRLACIRLLKKYKKPDQWLRTHGIDRVSYMLFSQHYQYDEYIVACLKKELLFIDNGYEEVLNAPPPPNGKNRTLKRGLSQQRQPYSEEEVKLRQSIVNHYGSIGAFYRYHGVSQAKFRTFVSIYLDCKQENII